MKNKTENNKLPSAKDYKLYFGITTFVIGIFFLIDNKLIYSIPILIISSFFIYKFIFEK